MENSHMEFHTVVFHSGILGVIVWLVITVLPLIAVGTAIFLWWRARRK